MSRSVSHLLGPPYVELDGEPVPISRRQTEALLAYLAARAPSTASVVSWHCSRQNLSRRAHTNLRRALSLLYRKLGHGLRMESLLRSSRH